MPRSRGSQSPRSRAANVARLEHAWLWEKYWLFRSVEVRNALVEALLPQAVNLACKTLHIALRGRRSAERSYGFGLTDDEKAEVVIGLIGVVERYDPSSGLLGTYMWYAVRGVVIDLWRKQGWFPRRWFSGEAERSANMLSLDKIRDDYERTDSAQHTDGWVPDALVNQEGILETENTVSAREECLRYLRMLSGHDKLVIQRRYIENVPFKVIAEELGVTFQYVSAIHKRAIRRLKILAEESVYVRIGSNEKYKERICT